MSPFIKNSAGVRRNVVVVTASLILVAGTANASGPFRLDLPLIFDTSSNPMSMPENPRAHGVEMFLWNGIPHMMINTGNELELSDISDPQSPANVQESSFGVPPYGDRDYNLYRFSLCDECRFGTTDYAEAGSVLFDLGLGPDPVFGPSQHYTVTGTARMTFAHDGQQYLVANGFGASCGQFASLHEFNGISLADLPPVACLTGPPTSGFAPHGGAYIVGPGGDGFLYLSDGYGSIHVFRLIDGATLGIEYLGSPILGRHVRGEGWGLDRQHDLFAGVLNGTIRLYDINDPADPGLVSSWSVSDSLPNADLVAMSWPLLWVGRSGQTAARTFNIEDPHHPREIDRGFWANCHPWNGYEFSAAIDSEFTDDGLWLILSRFSVVERFEIDSEHLDLVFRDGFECGNGSPWTQTIPVPTR